MPAFSGPGADPTRGFTDMQWYMYHQRNVAFFAAFTSVSLDESQLLERVRRFAELTPQLATGYRGANPGAPLADDVLRRLIQVERVETLDGFPERWVDDGARVFDDPSLPLFRIRFADRGTQDANGRVGFVIVQVSHALVEGADSALLTRSQSAAHPLTRSATRTAPLTRAAAVGLGAILAGLHLLAGNFYSPHPGPFRYAARTVPRSSITQMARGLRVRQRALLFALVMETLCGAASSGARRSLTSTYSVIDEGGGASRDSFMRMRMRFARFTSASGFAEFARRVDDDIVAAETKESGFNDEMNAQGIAMHRRLQRLLPFAYSPRLFTFMPYDIVIGLIPPHRLGGGLTAMLEEPVFAGAALEGANACVIVPGRRLVTFNYYVQEALLTRLSRFDALLAEPILSSGVHPEAATSAPQGTPATH
ncbi:MAG TPA: hypothetical protein VG757_10110 [Devosia sp.]|nr:hypothetical protein [Devosia sp.]